LTNKIQGPFAPMPIWAFDLISKRGTPTHTHILMTVMRLTPLSGPKPMTVAVLAQSSGMSPETVKRSLRWLESAGIISSERLSGNRGKHIVVRFKPPKRGVTHDPTLPQGGVTHDLSGGSLVTPPRASEQGEFHSRDSIRDIVQREMSKDISLCGLRPFYEGEESMPIFGADPDDTREWDETPALEKLAHDTSDVLQHFNFVARQVGGTPVEVKDRPAFRVQIKRLLKNGVTPADLQRMIEKFFTFSRHVESPTSWKSFCANSVQASLLSEATEIIAVSPILGWIADEFEHTDVLPWDEEINTRIRKLIWRRAMDLAYTYPELLADIVATPVYDATQHPDGTELLSTLLFSASTLLSEPGEASAVACLTEHGVNVPDDLMGHATLRKPAASLRQAVATYQQFRRTQ